MTDSNLAAQGAYWAQLLPASFRNVPFSVERGQANAGRRIALHQYPGRDKPYAEDMGRAARQFTVEGFLVGDDVIAQRDRLLNAIETEGPGGLVHPTFGTLTVSVEGFHLNEQHGRVVNFELRVVESGKRLFPTAAADTGSDVSDAANAADAAASADFSSQISSSGALSDGAQSVGQAVSASQSWCNMAQQQVGAATALYHAAASLPGPYGRYAGGNTVASSSATSLSGLMAQAAQARVSVGAAGANLVSTAAGLGL